MMARAPEPGIWHQKLYDVLAVREAEWLSQIYALYGKTPGELAGEGQMPAGSIPESLKEFKGVQITFTNGDGTVIWDSSNVKANYGHDQCISLLRAASDMG